MPDTPVRSPGASSDNEDLAPVRVRSPFLDEAEAEVSIPIQPRFGDADPLIIGGSTTRSPEIDLEDLRLETGNPPGSPQNVQVGFGSAGIVILSWTAVAGADGYQVQTQAGVEIQTVVGQSTTAMAVPLASGTYGLTAFNGFGESQPTLFTVS